MIELFLDRYIYWGVLLLLAIGLYGMLVMGNLAKKLVGLVIFTTAIYLFFIHGSLVEDGTVPIIDPAIGSDPTRYVDPLPHLLILTAIVVGVGILGVGLALLVRIHEVHGTFDEAVVAANLAGGNRPLGVDAEALSEASDGTLPTDGDDGPGRGSTDRELGR
jgi:multicomponent Na+:H+ antiporter subunit C